jgi:hypothetical protein
LLETDLTFPRLADGVLCGDAVTATVVQVLPVDGAVVVSARFIVPKQLSEPPWFRWRLSCARGSIGSHATPRSQRVCLGDPSDPLLCALFDEAVPEVARMELLNQAGLGRGRRARSQ